MWRALFMVLALLAAGCVTPLDGASDDDAGELDVLDLRGPFVDPIDPGHDHGDLDAHALSTPTLDLVGHSNLGDDEAQFTNFGEMDWHGDVMAIAAIHVPEPRRAALVLADVSDPENPTRLGYALLVDENVPVDPFSNTPGGAYPLDVKFDDAGEFVYVSANGRVLAYDVRDPANPVLAGGMASAGFACHMIRLGVIDGTEYLFCTGDPVGLSVHRVVAPSEGARTLVPVSYSRPEGETVRTGGSLFGGFGAPHDLTFQLDPVDETPLLVVSNRQFGVRVLDVSDPTRPEEIGRWEGEGAEYYSPHMHTAMVTVVDGTRYLIVTPEILQGDYPPSMYVLDATDYGDLKLAAEWWTPNAHASPGFLLTMHQWQVAGDRVYMGNYHWGVWVLDLPTILAGGHLEDPEHPEVLGYYLPHEPPVEDGQDVPYVWDLTLKDGLIYVTDVPSGLYVLNYVEDEIGDPAVTGFN